MMNGERAGFSWIPPCSTPGSSARSPGSWNRSGIRVAGAWREVIGSRSRRAFERLSEERNRLHLDSPPTLEQALAAIRLERELAFVRLYDGAYDEAAARLLRQGAGAGPRRAAAGPGQHDGALGVAALRRGEQDNCIACVGPSSCIFPIAREAMHTRPDGSREAVRWFTEYLDEWPGDLRVRWLLNIAVMTLGEYPQGCPLDT